MFPHGRMWSGAAGDAVVKPRRPMTPATSLAFDSVTKLAAAALAMRLVEEGKLRLDDPIVRWYPGWRGDAARRCATCSATPPARATRGRQFDPSQPLSQKIALARLRSPGRGPTVGVYSNVGYMIAGHVLGARGS